jgi:hypothetical protein
MRTLMHRLQALAEKFLAYEEISSDKISMNLYLLKKLSSRESFNLMQKVISETEEIISESNNKDSDYYLKLSELQYFKDTIYSYNFALKKGQEPGKGMSYQSEFLIQYFLHKILNHYYLLLNHSLLINFTPHLDMLDEIIGYIRKNEDYFDNSSLKLSFYLVLLLKESNDEYFYSAKKILFHERSKLSLVDKYSASIIMRNYCRIKYLKQFDKKYMEEAFVLQCDSLEHDYYSVRIEKTLRNSQFISFIDIAMSVDKIDWAEDFVEKYKPVLEADFKEETLKFCSAKLSFARKDFHSALDILAGINKFPDVIVNLYIRNLRLMIFYELDWSDQAASAVDAYSHFLRKDKLIAEWRKQYFESFLKVYSKILKLKENPNNKINEASTIELKNQIARAGLLDTRGWLIDKIGELSPASTVA